MMTQEWQEDSAFTLVNLSSFEAKKAVNDADEKPTFGWGRGKAKRQGKKDVDVVYDPYAASNKPESKCLMIGEWPEFAMGYLNKTDAQALSQQWSEQKENAAN